MRKVGTLFAVCFCLLLIAGIVRMWGHRDREAKSFQQRVSGLIDNPAKLQDWAIPILQNQKVGYEVPREDWPAYLKSEGGPSSVWVSGLGKGQQVVVTWGGGFGHTAVIVGEKDFVIPSDDFLGRPVFKWIPGVYFDPYGW